MNVLGIETSCDETAASVVAEGRWILSSEVSSSESFHRRYGGIVPEIASRMQLESVACVADSALKSAGLKLKDIGLLSVTAYPGLPGSLLVGTSFARAAAWGLGLPLVEVDHLQSHIYADFLREQPLRLPCIALVVSGGHTSLFLVRDFCRINCIGQTLDDACGEAFDKVAKMLGLGYPGGPAIEKAALKGNPRRISFNCSDTKNPLDFSFSGIKTSVLYYLQRQGSCVVRRASCVGPKIAKCKTQNAQRKAQIADIAASFQEAAFDALVEKSLLACKIKKIPRLSVGGGVAANSRLRQKLASRAKERGLEVSFAARPLCTDNAAMVAGLGFWLHKAAKGGRKIC